MKKIPKFTVHSLFFRSSAVALYVFFVYFFSGLECVGHFFASAAHLIFLRDVWTGTRRAAGASRRASATNLATHLPLYSTVLYNKQLCVIYTPDLGQKRKSICQLEGQILSKHGFFSQAEIFIVHLLHRYKSFWLLVPSQNVSSQLYLVRRHLLIFAGKVYVYLFLVVLW